MPSHLKWNSAWTEHTEFIQTFVTVISPGLTLYKSVPGSIEKPAAKTHYKQFWMNNQSANTSQDGRTDAESSNCELWGTNTHN